MSTQSTIRKVIAATAISAVVGLTSLVGGAASADGPSSSGKMVNVYSIILTNATVSADGASVSAGTDATAKKPGRTTFANIVLERGY